MPKLPETQSKSNLDDDIHTEDMSMPIPDTTCVYSKPLNTLGH